MAKKEFRRRVSEGVTFSEAYKSVEMGILTDQPVFIWGPPGIGKSALCQEIARKHNLTYIDLRMSLLNPIDLRGTPYADAKTDTARWLPPAFLPRTEGHLINFDELNIATPTVQAAAYQLILDRKCGEYVMPKRCFIVACGNRSKDKAIVHEMPAPLRNRMMHVEMKEDYDDWKSWAFRSGVHPAVIGFLGWKNEALFQFDPKEHQRGFPTPRSWEFVSKIAKQVYGDREMGSAKKSKSKDPLTDDQGSALSEYAHLIDGCVGGGTAREFMAYVKVSEKLPNMRSIILEGTTPKCPSDPGVSFALSSGLVHLACTLIPKLKDKKDKKKSVQNLFSYLVDHMTKEFGILTSKDLARTEFWKDQGGRELLLAAPIAKKWSEKIGKICLG